MRKERYKKPCTEGNVHWFGVYSGWDGGIEPVKTSTQIATYEFDYCPWCGEKLDKLVEKEDK